jgi:MoaA/NifB/PqqE/SkfB family radical SAM enzyme
MMAMSLFQKVIKEAKQLGADSLGLHYNGEATLHPEYPTMLRLVGKQRFGSTTYSTNGMGVSDEVVAATVEGAIKVVNISVHTTSDEPIGFARRLGEARKVARQGRPRITATYGFDGASKEVIQGVYNRYKNVVDSFGVTGTIRTMRWAILPPDVVKVPRKRCYQPMRYVAVLWDGRLTICCRDLAGELAFGNARRRSLAEELASPVAGRRRQEIVSDGHPSDRLCRRCKLWQTVYRWAPYKG